MFIRGGEQDEDETHGGDEEPPDGRPAPHGEGRESPGGGAGLARNDPLKEEVRSKEEAR